MFKSELIELFDNEEYKKVYDRTNPYKKDSISDYEILYFLKSKIVLDDFKIKDKQEIKKIFFYYFYLVGKVEFDNNYSFSFNKELLRLNFIDLDDNIKGLKDFKQYFNLGKNDIFLNNIVDTTIKYKDSDIKKGVKKVDNIIDFFIRFSYECSELYAFSGEHFPLFKWIINKI